MVSGSLGFLVNQKQNIERMQADIGEMERILKERYGVVNGNRMGVELVGDFGGDGQFHEVDARYCKSVDRAREAGRANHPEVADCIQRYEEIQSMLPG